MKVMIANDPVFGNSRSDDLYTAGLGFAVQQGWGHLELGERMFTDRQAGQRFDETYLNLEKRFGNWGPFEVTLGAGLLHLGKGLLGESVQNSVHRAIGSEVVELDYLAGTHLYGELVARLERHDLFGAGRLLETSIEARSAPGFRSWLRAMSTYEASFGHHFSWRAGLGIHAEDASLDLLENSVRSLAPTAELGIAWRSLTLLWSYNDLGTASSHLTLGMKVPLHQMKVGEAAR